MRTIRLVPITAAALTLGWVVLYIAEPTAKRRRHEGAHVVQCLVLGPLAVIAYPLASLWAWARGGDYYRDNVFERMAREAAG